MELVAACLFSRVEARLFTCCDAMCNVRVTCKAYFTPCENVFEGGTSCIFTKPPMKINWCWNDVVCSFEGNSCLAFMAHIISYYIMIPGCRMKMFGMSVIIAIVQPCLMGVRLFSFNVHTNSYEK